MTSLCSALGEGEVQIGLMAEWVYDEVSPTSYWKSVEAEISPTHYPFSGFMWTSVWSFHGLQALLEME